jgi:adenylosuccinate synthase
MEAGISPRLVDEIIMVVRTFPIRVAGEQAGPLRGEITWENLQRESGYPHDLTELTTVTRKRRRVARFDLDLVLDACQVNRPTSLVVHGLDYLGYENLSVTRFSDLNIKAKQFLKDLRQSTGVAIKYAFTGRHNASVVADVECGLERDCNSDDPAREDALRQSAVSHSCQHGSFGAGDQAGPRSLAAVSL